MLRNHIRRRVSKRAHSNDQALSTKNLQGYQKLMATGRSCSLKRTAVAWPSILVWPYGHYSSTFFNCLMINPAASCVYRKTCQNLNLEQNQHMPDHASRSKNQKVEQRHHNWLFEPPIVALLFARCEVRH